MSKSGFNALLALPFPARCALVRLFSRKGHWFRSDKINYQEIDDFPLQIERLSEQGFIRSSNGANEMRPSISCSELARDLLTKPELFQVFTDLVSNRSARKDVLLQQLPDETFYDFEQLPFVCIELLQPELIDLLLVLFFGNTHQDLSQFVLSDLGLNTFEPVTISLSRLVSSKAVNRWMSC